MITLKWTEDDVKKMMSNLTGRRATSVQPCAQTFKLIHGEPLLNSKGMWFGQLSWTTNNATPNEEISAELTKSSVGLTLMWTNLLNVAVFSIDIVQKQDIAFDKLDLVQGTKMSLQFVGYVIEFD